MRKSGNTEEQIICLLANTGWPAERVISNQAAVDLDSSRQITLIELAGCGG
jgi:hypothetical protein